MAYSSMSHLEDLRMAVVGMGLMGGSLALALKPHVKSISGVDRNPTTVNYAVETGVVDSATVDLARGIQDADVIVLSTPVSSIIELVHIIPTIRQEGCMLLDLGSTKRTISNAMNQLPGHFQAIGGHPICGKEVSGLRVAQGDLFKNQSFVLCSNDRTTQSIKSVVSEIVSAIGAHEIYLSPEDHDEIVSFTSHLPYIVSAILFALVSSQPSELKWDISASGLKDTTRLAGSNPNVMIDILLNNRDRVLKQLRKYREMLSKFDEVLDSNDSDALSSWLNSIQTAYGQYRKYLKPKAISKVDHRDYD